MFFSVPPAIVEEGGGSVKNLPGARATGSNQAGSVSPGLPASPQPGLKGAGLVDSVFFGEEHV
jgi:hypothetical protein